MSFPIEAASLAGTPLSNAVFTVVVGTSLALLLLQCTRGNEDAPVPLLVGRDRERKKLQPLILPAECVHVIQRPLRSDLFEKSSRPLLRNLSTHARAWVSGRPPWSSLELKKDSNEKDRRDSKEGASSRRDCDCGDRASSSQSLGDRPTSSRSRRPLLVLVNTRSGGRQGTELLRNFRRVLHYTQVVDLREEDPQAALQWWSQTGLRYRVLACGGDGTAGWVLSCLEVLKPEYIPPVAILPLGTGNDLARILGWGSGFGGSSILPVLEKVGQAHAAYLDRWQVSCRDKPCQGRPATLPSLVLQRKTVMMYNYFGIGIDAAVALDFHQMRERSPHLFFSRLVNKMLYVRSGMLHFTRTTCKKLNEKMTLECDGQEVAVPAKVEGIVVLNISSFGGGCDLWGCATNEEESDSDFSSGSSSSPRSLSETRPSMRDKKLEVVGVHGSIQLGAAHVGLYRATRLAQASHVRITSKNTLPAQVDGEPWLFAANGEIDITHKSQALMLARQAADSHAVATDVIDWALEQNVIDVDQRNKLLSEIARRAQRKTLNRGGSGVASNSGSWIVQ